MYGQHLETCLTIVAQIQQICATLCRFASFLNHWKLKIPSGTCLCMYAMDGVAQLLTVEPKSGLRYRFTWADFHASAVEMGTALWVKSRMATITHQ